MGRLLYFRLGKHRASKYIIGQGVRVRFRGSTAYALIILSISGSANGATLIVNGEGVLTGATGVMVGGRSYTVTLADGTCASVYGTCSASSFDFTTVDDATLAARALLSQVFVDSSVGDFASKDRAKIYGCGSASACTTYVPYDQFSSSQIKMAYSVSPYNIYGTGGFGAAIDLSQPDYANINVARFSLEPSSVPDATSWTMFISGFVLVGSATRRIKLSVCLV